MIRKNFHSLLVPWARLELAYLAAGDFKSPVSTDFTTRAFNNFIIYLLFFLSVVFLFTWCLQLDSNQ